MNSEYQKTEEFFEALSPEELDDWRWEYHPIRHAMWLWAIIAGAGAWIAILLLAL